MTQLPACIDNNNLKHVFCILTRLYTRRHCQYSLPGLDELWSQVSGRWLVFFGVSTQLEFIRNYLNLVLNITLPEEAMAREKVRQLVSIGTTPFTDPLIPYDVYLSFACAWSRQTCVYIGRFGDRIFTRYPEGYPHEQQSVRITWFWIGDYPEQYDWGGGYGTATLTLPGFQQQVRVFKSEAITITCVSITPSSCLV